MKRTESKYKASRSEHLIRGDASLVISVHHENREYPAEISVEDGSYIRAGTHLSREEVQQLVAALTAALAEPPTDVEAELRSALVCPASEYGTHRCVRCDSEVEP